MASAARAGATTSIERPAWRVASAIASVPCEGRSEPSSASSPSSAALSRRAVEICPAGGEDRAGEREIEPAARLGQLARRQVRRDALRGKLEAGVADRRRDALARLTHRGVGETDDRERGQAPAHVDLDAYVAGLESVDREGVRTREHDL